jgi:hypothetical protein
MEPRHLSEHIIVALDGAHFTWTKSRLRISEVLGLKWMDIGLIGGPDRDRTDDLFHAIRGNTFISMT